MTMSDTTFSDGWRRFWGTFARPWPVVFGFAAAVIVLDIVTTIVKVVLTALTGR